MTLQERTFMCELIKRNYRRRMLIFSLFIIAISMPIAIGIVLKLDASLSLIPGIISFAFFLLAIFRYEEDELPWKIKKRQSEALKAFSESDFGDMICSVPLKEYFNS